MPVKPLHQAPHLLLGSSVLIRDAMKVNKDYPATALHQPISRHRRINAARDQRGDASARPDRQTAGSSNFSETEKGVVRQNFHGHGKFGMLQIDSSHCFFLYR